MPSIILEMPSEKPAPKTMNPKKLTGVVHGVVYNPHPLGFANFSITTMIIENGVIKSIELSDYYNAQETITRLTKVNEDLVDKMRCNYPPEYRHV